MKSSPLSVMGLPNGGLTEACVDHYHRILTLTQHPDRILFLVRNQRKANQVRELIFQVRPDCVGPLRVETFLAFVGRVLADHWLTIRQQVPSLPPQWEPLPLAKDLTQFLLSKTCDLCPRHAPTFQSIGLRPYQLWDQISSAAYIAGSAGLDPSEVGSRLSQAWPETELAVDPKPQQLAALSCCVDRLRQQALQLGCLDYGTQLALFQQWILPHPQFWSQLEHLVVDQVEESSAVALAFYEQALPRLDSCFFAYTLGGGAAFTAVPRLIREFLDQHTQTRILEPEVGSDPAMAYVGAQIASALDPGFRLPFSLTIPDEIPPIRILSGEMQQDALEPMLAEIERLLKEGTDPAQIAVISPRLDAGLRLTVQNRLGDPVQVMGSFPSLIKYPLIRAQLTLAELAYPGWGLVPSLADLKVMLAILLNLDLIRAELLAEDAWDRVNHCCFPSPAIRYPERIGFAALQRYQQLLDWLLRIQTQPEQPIDLFFRQLFADLLSTLITQPADQLLIQTLIDTASRFRLTLPHLPARDFLQMIRSSQVATTSFSDPDYSQSLVMATPLGYINQGLSADYHFWFDITHHSWSRSLWHPLYNSEVLSPQWDGQVFGEEQDFECKHRQLANLLFTLSCRVRRGIWLVRSSFNAWGEENTSLLDQQILKTVS